jgi:hypothetical protein
LLPQQPRPLNAAGGGFRCLKLGTVRAPVRVRVVEAGTTGRPRVPENVVLYVGRQGFSRNETDARVPDNDGYYSSDKEKDGALYDGLAFVTVTQGGQPRAQVPLALVDQRTITLPIRVGAEAPALLTQRSLWEQSLLNEWLTLDGLVKSLTEDIGKADRRAAAVARAHKALESLDQRLPHYAEERKELANARQPAGAKPLDLSKGDRRLKEVKDGRERLREWVANMDAILKEENTPEAKEAKSQYEQAHGLEAEGDYGRAIELYEKVLARTKDAKLEQRLKKLKAAWEPQGDEHKKARAFIYDTWPKLESPTVMKERVKEAQKALAVCRKVKDPFGPRKLLKVALLHATKLTQQAEALSPEFSEQDAKPAQELAEVLKPLAELIAEAKKDVEQTPVP